MLSKPIDVWSHVVGVSSNQLPSKESMAEWKLGVITVYFVFADMVIYGETEEMCGCSIERL